MPISISDRVRSSVLAAIDSGELTANDIEVNGELDHEGVSPRVRDIKGKVKTSAVLQLENPISLTAILAELAAVNSAIDAKRAQFPGFGDPTTSLQYGVGDNGYYRHYQGGSIFWTPTFGAHEVHGAIRDHYSAIGWQQSYLGYPTTDELTTTTNGKEVRYSNFAGGTIKWMGDVGAYVDLSISVRLERHQLGYFVDISGQGFTPGGTVRFTVEGLEGFQGSKSIGTFVIAKPDGTFKDAPWDGRTWTGGGDAHLRALDQSSGRTVTASVPPALLISTFVVDSDEHVRRPQIRNEPRARTSVVP